VPADATLIEGAGDFDLSLLSGESLPQQRAEGDGVPGGAINAGQPVLLRVTRPVADSTLARLVLLVERAGQTKPALALWADRLARWFVLVLLVLVVLVFLAWRLVDPSRAWEVAIALLVVSCPCALSLATPTALASATGALLRRGVLVVQPHVLETLHRATHVVFDKTGTLTEGRPKLQQVSVLGALAQARCLQLAAALEASSAHPLARALRSAAEGPLPQAQALRSEAGQGVEGCIDGVLYRLGRAGFAWHARDDGDGSASSVWLACEAGLLARFALCDSVRPEAAALVHQFQAQGKQVVLLSGDQQMVATRVAVELGIPVAIGACLPEQKLDYVRRLQAGGAVVAMVGDGINDAAVLRAADVSFAMGGGAALAQLHADAVLLGGRLAALGEATSIAARTLAVIRQNLAWASVYNLMAIPAAAFGLLNPWLCAAGMSLSSALVVANALRLRRAGA
jgi:Cu2+-exporting ATPase